MNLKTMLTALALALAPSLAFAQGCDHSREVTQSCAEGTVLDTTTGICVPRTTS